MSEKTQETAQKDYEVDLKFIKPLERAGGNIRSDYGEADGSFDELVESIAENGILNPMRAYRDADNPGYWFSIDGHRRHRAGMKLVDERGASIRVRVIPVDRKKISDESLVIDMVTTNTGKPLNPLELSEAVRRLISYGLRPKDIAKKFGMKSYVIKNLELLGSAPKRIRNLIQNNQLSHTVALGFLKSSADYNEAIEKIEKALSLAKSEKPKTKESDFPGNPDTESESDNENDTTKITTKHLNEVNNKVDSTLELRKVFKKQIDSPSDIKNNELFSFCKKLVDNKLMASDIEKLLF